MSKHTPGPWVLDIEGIFDCIRDERGNAIIHGDRDGGLYCDPENARLIAAAPDLLAELKKARDHIKEHFDSFIESSIDPKTGLINNPHDQIFAESDQDLINGIDAAIAKAEAA